MRATGRAVLADSIGKQRAEILQKPTEIFAIGEKTQIQRDTDGKQQARRFFARCAMDCTRDDVVEQRGDQDDKDEFRLVPSHKKAHWQTE